ncbi:hypothetical protein ON010_g9962 [Phytophthora cinnamomi]|nr:hypothetical protein ON010_g9962 [Phytophthora cinnamomi]
MSGPYSTHATTFITCTPPSSASRTAALATAQPVIVCPLRLPHPTCPLRLLHAAEQQQLRQLLLARHVVRLARLLGVGRHLLQRGAALLDALAQRALPRRVALLDHVAQLVLLQQLGGLAQAAREAVHGADVRDEDVLEVRGLAAHLGVEVEASGREAADLDELLHDEHGLLLVHEELVRVPADERVARVAVHGAQHLVAGGVVDVVLVVVARERRVVGLDVELEVVLQAVGVQEGDDRGGVVVVLVLHGLARLGLDEELEGGAQLLLVGHHELEEGGHVVQLHLHVGVEDALEALAAAPEDEVLAAQLERDLHGLLDARRRVREHLHVRVGAGAVHEAAVAEEVGGPPEALDARLVLLLEQVVRDVVQQALGLVERGALGDEVHVVERVVLDAELGEHLEGGVGLALGGLEQALARRQRQRQRSGVQRLVPRAVRVRLAAERVAARVAERVPVADGEAAPLLHGLAQDHLGRVVLAVGERALGAGALERDLGHVGEVLLHLVLHHGVRWLAGWRVGRLVARRGARVAGRKTGARSVFGNQMVITSASLKLVKIRRNTAALLSNLESLKAH